MRGLNRTVSQLKTYLEHHKQLRSALAESLASHKQNNQRKIDDGGMLTYDERTSLNKIRDAIDHQDTLISLLTVYIEEVETVA